MKKVLVMCGLLVLVMSVSLAQTVERLPNETTEAFAKRVFNRTDFVHPIIEVKEKGWCKDTASKIIICFYGDDEIIIGQLLIPISKNQYQKVLIDTLNYSEEADMRNLNIESVFFANADSDKERELVVMFTIMPGKDLRGTDAYLDGFYYNTYIYDNPNLAHIPERLTYFQGLSSIFSFTFDGKTYNKATGLLMQISISPYKDVESVRKALKTLGY